MSSSNVNTVCSLLAGIQFGVVSLSLTVCFSLSKTQIYYGLNFVCGLNNQW